MKITLCSLQITFSGARFLLSFFPTFFLWREKENYKYAIYSFLLHCIKRRSHIEKEAYPCRQGSSCLREQVQFAIRLLTRSEEKKEIFHPYEPKKNQPNCMSACVFSHNIDEWLPPRKYGKLNLTQDKTDKKARGSLFPFPFPRVLPLRCYSFFFSGGTNRGFIGLHWSSSSSSLLFSQLFFGRSLWRRSQSPLPPSIVAPGITTSSPWLIGHLGGLFYWL